MLSCSKQFCNHASFRKCCWAFVIYAISFLKFTDLYHFPPWARLSPGLIISCWMGFTVWSHFFFLSFLLLMFLWTYDLIFPVHSAQGQCLHWRTLHWEGPCGFWCKRWKYLQWRNREQKRVPEPSEFLTTSCKLDLSFWDNASNSHEDHRRKSESGGGIYYEVAFPTK